MIVAAKRPPINIDSLRDHDMTEILKDRQVRHDLLFDILAFRPARMTAPFLLADSGTVRPVTPRIASVFADMYWDSIAAELASGCRCTMWKAIGCEGEMARFGEWAKTERVNSCVCGKWMRGLSEVEWWERQARSGWLSRLPELVKSQLTFF